MITHCWGFLRGSRLAALLLLTLVALPAADTVSLAGVETATLTAREDQAPAAVTATLTVTSTSATATAAEVAIPTNLQAGQDVLAFVPENGITATWNGTTGVLRLTGTAPIATYQAALRKVTFQNTSQAPTVTPRSLRFTVTVPGPVISAPATRPLAVTAVNDAPVVSALETTTVTATEGAAPVVVTTTVALTDVDSAALTQARVQLSSGYQNGQDLLGVPSLPPGLMAAWDGSTGILTLSGSASPAVYQTALRTVTFTTLSDKPSTTARAVRITVYDGAAWSNGPTRPLAVVATNDAPILTALESTAVDYRLGMAPTVVTALITPRDIDSANLTQAKVQITTGYQIGADVLSFSATTGITGVWDAATGVLTLSGSASLGTYQSALRTVRFQTTSGSPVLGTRQVQFTAWDGSAWSAPVARSVTVGSLRPTLTSVETHALGYVPGQAATAVTGSAVVADADSPLLAQARVAIVHGYRSDQDELSYLAANGITGTWNAAAGVLTLSGSASPALYQTALRSVKYRNTSATPFVARLRVLEFTVSDGVNASVAIPRSVALSGGSVAPVVAGVEPAALSFVPGQPAAALTTGLTVTDADSPWLSQATVQITTGYLNGQDELSFVGGHGITGSWSATTGTMTLRGFGNPRQYQAALRSVRYRLASSTPSTAARQVTFRVSDGVQWSAPVLRSLAVSTPTVQMATAYAYDRANRLETRTAGGLADGFTYDTAGRLQTATSARYGNQVQRYYDAAGRLVTEIQVLEGIPFEVRSTYDAAGRLIAQVYPDGTLVQRPATTRGQLFQVIDQGTLLQTRLYDLGGRQTTATASNGRQETRTYANGSVQVGSIAIPGVTDLAYTYDLAKRKTAEVNASQQGQRFGYDRAGRLTTWSQGTAVTSSASQAWTLSLVGDWQQVTTKVGATTSTETRTHTPVHEIAAINGQTLQHDGRGNLTRDAQGQTYAWDADGRLASAGALAQGRGTSATYRYDALGRRVSSTVQTGATASTTWYLMAGPQVVTEIVGDLAAFNDPATDPEALGAAPFNPATGQGARGSLLADPLALRFNVQPASSDTPDGWLPDTGKVAATSSVRGWAPAVTPVDRDALGRPLYDTHVPMGTSTWSIPVANGTHAVVIMCGDASSRAQTNHLRVNGVAVTDPTPYQSNEIPGYETGSFDGYAINVHVTDGFVRIQAGVGGLNPKVCFVEIGAVGSSVDQATIDRVTKAAGDATKATGYPRPAKPPEVKRLVYGSYVDELVSYTVQKPRKAARRYFVHNNSLYSPQAVTDVGGGVVERYAYDAYGRQTITSGGGLVLTQSAVGLSKGFTGQSVDAETGLMYFRARMYSPKLGRFVSRDPIGYVDGFGLYSGYFIPNELDPLGLSKCPDANQILKSLLSNPKGGFQHQINSLYNQLSQEGNHDYNVFYDALYATATEGQFYNHGISLIGKGVGALGGWALDKALNPYLEKVFKETLKRAGVSIVAGATVGDMIEGALKDKSTESILNNMLAGGKWGSRGLRLAIAASPDNTDCGKCDYSMTITMDESPVTTFVDVSVVGTENINPNFWEHRYSFKGGATSFSMVSGGGEPFYPGGFHSFGKGLDFEFETD